MTDSDIIAYIEACEEPIFLRDIMGELTSQDPTVSWKRVTRLMREMGYENRVCKNALNERGKGSSWRRVNSVPTDDYDVSDADVTDETDGTDDDEIEEQEERSTEAVISDVKARNAETSDMNRRLLETVQISRTLRQEMMEKHIEALVSMARMILSIHGTDDEKRRYF